MARAPSRCTAFRGSLLTVASLLDDALSSSEVQFNEGDMIDEDDSDALSSTTDPRARSASASASASSEAPLALLPLCSLSSSLVVSAVLCDLRP